LKSSVQRSITFPDLLEKTMADDDTMDLFKVVLLGSFDRMGERIAGTKNDIRISPDFACAQGRITVPTLVVHGTHDPLVPFAEHGKTLSERIPGAKLCLGERGEHTTIFTHRALVKSAVREFLKE
jgi:pimeloyl-ACP methyl ester carboxylesterase